MNHSNPISLIAGMASWHLGHTAREFEKFDALAGYWVSNSSRSGVSERKYRRIWDYHLAQKLFYHLPFPNLEEEMRWINLPFYERWIARQTLPEGTTVVQGPMGSCEALFRLAERSGRRVLKVFDAPNSHPTNLVGYWQRECDLYAPGYRVPMCLAARSRINRELEQADLILCPSNFVRDTMVLNGIPAKKCFISHFGVDTSIFVPRKELPPVPTFVSVGSICLRKGHQYLFRAFEEVKRQLPDARLICVGGVRPDFKPEWKRWEGSFEHHPSLSHPEVAHLLASATAFVLPSVEEGFARVLSEAMACGLPVIATYETGATTVIRDGQEGFIVPARNVPALTEAMVSAAANRDQNLEMGRKALFAGGASNTWADYAKRLHDEYSNRLNSH
jgi:glycosyltransferase involved in cell wall biosynthesis